MGDERVVGSLDRILPGYSIDALSMSSVLASRCVLTLFFSTPATTYAHSLIAIPSTRRAASEAENGTSISAIRVKSDAIEKAAPDAKKNAAHLRVTAL